MGDKRFHEHLALMAEIHESKSSDYGHVDPLSNLRAAANFGVDPWIGTLLRMSDKVARLQKAARGGTMTNESVRDSLLDLASYSLLALILYEETQ